MPKHPPVIIVGMEESGAVRFVTVVRFRFRRPGSAIAPGAEHETEVGTIDIRFGYDAQYVNEGETYLVGAYQHPDLGILSSKLTESPVDFAGDEIVGVSENDVVCPDPEDPIMTLNVDGTSVDFSIVDPMLSERSNIAAALLVPFTIVMGVIFLLAMLRLSSQSLFASLRDLRRPARRRPE